MTTQDFDTQMLAALGDFHIRPNSQVVVIIKDGKETKRALVENVYAYKTAQGAEIRIEARIG